MNIEQEIFKTLRQPNNMYASWRNDTPIKIMILSWRDIKNSEWVGMPNSLICDLKFKQPSWETINKLIKEGDVADCLTSSYKYIRECKKYYMDIK